MKLTVSNFQIHKEPNTIDIPEGETTYLDGDSDTGKSAMMRAMRWVCENKPDGGSFVTFKQPRGTCSVSELEVDGHVIKRERGKSKNSYFLDGEEFKAFGRSVPEPIAEVLKLSPYAIQLQGEVPFLIGDSPTDAAKILSEACGLGVIDTVVQYVRQKKNKVDADIRKADILIESAQGRLSDAEKQLPLAEVLEKTADAGEAVEQLQDNVEDLNDAIEDQPTGKLIEVGKVCLLAREAHKVEADRDRLASSRTTLHQAIADEPQGEILDIYDIFPKVKEAKSIAEDMSVMAQAITDLTNAIADVPTGVYYDLTDIRFIFNCAKERYKNIPQLQDTVAYLTKAIADEPKGTVIDVSAITPLVASAKAMESEKQLLTTMVAQMQNMLSEEPAVVLIDTTDLVNQRAQIKVCPMCGKEL